MASLSHLPLFLALALCLVCMTAFALPTIDILDAFPQNSEHVTVRCSDPSSLLRNYQATLTAGKDFQFTPKIGAIHYCDAVWGKLIADWHGFDPSRDGNHATIYWRANKDGIFRSYDKSSWVMEAPWDSE